MTAEQFDSNLEYPVFYRVRMLTETALFMHGARGPDSAELRPTAFRGALRYWFRCLLLSVAPLDRAREVECSVFGTPDHRSSLMIRLRRIRSTQGHAFELPHKEDEKRRQRAGCYQAGSEFEIELADHFSGEANPQLHAALRATLWTMSCLGGVGARSRRGAGTLRLVAQSRSDFPELGQQANAEELSLAIGKGLALARTAASILAGTHTEAAEDLPRLSSNPERTRIVVASLGEGEEQEMRSRLMMRLREFKNPAFGLPLLMNGSWVTSTDRRVQQFASPVWLRLMRGQGQWFVVGTFMPPTPQAEGIDLLKVHGLFDSFAGRVEVVSREDA